MKSCDFSTSSTSTKSWFKTNGLIDQYLNIKDLVGFRKNNTKWSNYARQQYGVNGRLFLEENNGTKAIPNEELFKQIDNKKKGNFQLESDKGLPNEKIESKIKTWLNSVGVDYKPTEKIYDINGQEINAIAKSDILNKTIEVIEGKRDITTLPEEAGHFLVELLGENHPLYKKMLNDITKYDVYNQVLNSEYANIYQNDELSLKKEAIGKMIGQYIISNNIENENHSKVQSAKTWFGLAWNYIKAKLKNLIGSKYREEITSFSQAANIILSNETKDLQSIGEVQPKYNNIFYELDPTVQQNILNKLKETGVTYNPATKKYTQQGKEVSKRVSDRVKAFYNRRFRNPLEEESPKSKLLAMKGSIIHSYNQNIMNAIIEGKEFTKGTIEKEVIESFKDSEEFKDKENSFYTLKPKEFNELVNLTKGLYNRIQSQQDEINKQTGRDDKVVILPEQILYDANKDEAGTVDMLAIFSNGTASIYDYKGINFFTVNNQVTGEIPTYKQDAYDIQVLEYMNLLRDNFGIDSFVETRIIPINLQLNYNNEKGFYKVEAGTTGNDESYREYLEELPVANELTGIKEIDEQLTKMFKLRDLERAKLNKDPKNTVLKARVQKINDSIRKLQINKDTRYAYKEVYSILQEYNKRKILHESNKDSFTLSDLSDYEEYLKVYKGFFENAIDIETSKIKGNEDLSSKIEATYYRLNKQINLQLKDIANKRIEILNREFNRDMTQVSKESSWLGMYFNQLSEFSRNQFKALSQLVKSNEVEVRENVDRIRDLIEKKTTKLKEWGKSKGLSLQDAYNKIYDNKTGQLKRKFNSIYQTEKKEAISKNNLQWFLDNTQIEKNGDVLKYTDPELQKRFEDIRDRNFALIDKSYPGDEFTKLREKNKANWTAKHDITKNIEALFNQPLFIKPKDNERFYTDNWKELNQSGNEPLLDFYNTLIDLNREFSEVTGKDLSDYNVAEVQKDMIDMLATNGVGGLTNLKDYLNHSLEIQQQDNLLGTGNIDPNTGEYIHSIPFLFTSNLTQSISDKEFKNLKEELLKTIPDENSVKFKDELKKQVLKIQREKGLQSKSSDLGRSVILLAEAAYTNAHLNTTLETVKALRSTLENSSTELTDNTNKSFIDKYTGKVMSKMGVPTSELEAFDKFVNLYWYGRKIQNKDILFKKESTEISELLGEQRNVSSNKVARSLMTYISAKALGLSWMTAVGSAIGASQNLMIQASEGRYFNTKEVRNAQKLLIKGDTKANLLTKYFEAYAKDMTYEKANGLSASKLSKVVTMDNLYIMMKKPDEFIDRIVMISILQHYGLVDGKLDRLSKLPEGTRSLFDIATINNDKIEIPGLNKDHYIQVRSFMQKVSSNIKGSIPQEDQNLLGTNIGTALLMQFKNWIPAMIKDRAKGIVYDENTNDLDIGRFRVFFGEFTEKGLLPKLKAFTNSLGEIAAFGKYNRYNDGSISAVAQKYYNRFLDENPHLQGKVSIDEFIQLRKDKLQGMAKELRSYLILFGLVALAKAAIPPDKDDDPIGRAIAMNAYRMSNRGLLELGFFLNPSSFLQITKRPIAVIGLFDDLQKIMKNTIDETKDIIAGENLSSDTTIPFYYTSKMIPGNRAVLDIFDIFDKFKVQ